MPRLNFNIQINASKEKVWNKLWSDEGYRSWTSVFTQGSYAESDWKEGSEIKFLSPDGSGMYGIIKNKVELVQMKFQHLGEIKNGIKEPKDWAGATEDYTLTENNGITDLKVEMDMTDEFVDYFNNIFPTALLRVKEISEA